MLPHLVEKLDRAAMQGHDEAIADDQIDVRDMQSSVGEMRRRQSRMQAFVVDVVAATARVHDGLFDGEVIDPEQAQGPLGGPGVTDVEVDPATQTPGAGGAGLLDPDGAFAAVLEVELYDGDRCHGPGPKLRRKQRVRMRVGEYSARYGPSSGDPGGQPKAVMRAGEDLGAPIALVAEHENARRDDALEALRERARGGAQRPSTARASSQADGIE